MNAGCCVTTSVVFQPRHRTTLYLVGLVERVNRNFDDKLLTGAVFIDVAKAFETMWVKTNQPNLPVLHNEDHILII